MKEMTDKKNSPKVLETFLKCPLSSKVMLLGVMVNRLSGFLQIFLVIYLTSLGHSKEQTIIALGIYGTGAVLGALLGGYICDRLGARLATIISMGSTAVLTAALLYMPNYWLILAMVAFASLATQLFRPASSTLLSQETPEERQTMVFAIYRLGLNLGATGAPMIGYGLFHLGAGSFTFVFWGEAAIAGLYTLLVIFTLPSKKVLTKKGKTSIVVQKSGYLRVLSDRRFMLYLFATFAHSAVFVQYVTTLPLYMEDIGMAIFWYTLAVSTNGFIVICLELYVTKFTQNFSKQTVMGIGFALIGSGVAFYGLPIGPAAIIAGTLIWTIGEIISGPAFFAHPAIAGPKELKAHYLGSFHFMFSLGIALGPIIGGWLYLKIGTYMWPVIASGSFLAAAISWYCAGEKTLKTKSYSITEGHSI